MVTSRDAAQSDDTTDVTPAQVGVDGRGKRLARVGEAGGTGGR